MNASSTHLTRFTLVFAVVMSLTTSSSSTQGHGKQGGWYVFANDYGYGYGLCGSDNKMLKGDGASQYSTKLGYEFKPNCLDKSEDLKCIQGLAEGVLRCIILILFGDKPFHLYTNKKKPKSDSTSGYNEETYAFGKTDDTNVANPYQTQSE